MRGEHLRPGGCWLLLLAATCKAVGVIV
jgi:hypothetical protein